MELVNELVNRYICGSMCLLLGIAQVVGGLRTIRTGKDFFLPRGDFGWGLPHFYKGQEARIQGKWSIRAGILFISLGVLMIALEIYSAFN